MVIRFTFRIQIIDIIVSYIYNLCFFFPKSVIMGQTMNKYGVKQTMCYNCIRVFQLLYLCVDIKSKL